MSLLFYFLGIFSLKFICCSRFFWNVFLRCYVLNKLVKIYLIGYEYFYWKVVKSVNFGENMNVFWFMKINYEIKSNIRN